MTLERSSKTKEKYKLLRRSQSALAGNDKFMRFQKCSRTPITGDEINLCCSESQKSGFYNGIMSCGSVWICPVCGSRISAHRCEEIKAGIENWIEQGGNVLLASFTCQHDSRDLLTELLEKQSIAFQKFWSNGSVKKPLREVGYSGKINASEVTCSKHNGWHPHRHVLLFVKGINSNDKEVLKEYFKPVVEQLQSKWLWALNKAGLTGKMDIALDVEVMNRCPEKVAEYVNKFSMEISLQQCKKGRKTRNGKETEHYTPFGLLQVSEESKEFFWARRKYIEYAECFKGRKQLFWSRGLKERLGIQHVSDAQILEAPLDTEFLVDIPKDDFKKIPDDFKVKLLEICEYSNPQRSVALEQAFKLLGARFDISYRFCNENPEEVQKRFILGIKQRQERKRRKENLRKFRTIGYYSIINGHLNWLLKDVDLFGNFIKKVPEKSNIPKKKLQPVTQEPVSFDWARYSEIKFQEEVPF